MVDTLIRVAIVEDDTKIRGGLRFLIDSTAGYRVTGAFGSVEEALPAIDAGEPHVVLMDIGLPGASGVEGIRLLKAEHPDWQFLVLSVYDDDHRVFDAICAGACGYLLKKTPPARLLESIRELAEGGAPMSPEIARRVVDLFRDVRPAAPVAHGLTPHESRLLRMLVEGHNYKTAATELGVSVNTVSFHMRKVYDKLQVHSKSQAVAKALRDRLT
jgi:DNA-binding NarL/FixJ family response regulator